MIDESRKHEIFLIPMNGILKIHDFIACHEHIIEYYNSRKNSINNRFKNLMLTDDDAEIYGQDFGEEMYDNDTTYPFIHKSSQLIALYSVLEVTVKEFSYLINDNINSPGNLRRKKKGPKENEVIKCKNFLHKYHNIKLPNKTTYFIAEFIELRNALVHHDGEIKKSFSRINNHVSFDNKIISSISDEYITYICNVLIDIFSSLGNQSRKITGIPSKSFFSYY